MYASHHSSKPLRTKIIEFFMMSVGAFLAAFALEVFFIPNQMIDGGTVGVAMIFGKLFGSKLLPLFLLIFNLPFFFLAYKSLGKTFVIHMLIAVALFAISLFVVGNFMHLEFKGDPLEVVVIGGSILGIGAGLIIRSGGSTDGTEILGLIINKRTGFTVGQVVLVCNVFVFGAAGLVFRDWHPPLLSLIAYIVVIKIMDAVIVGLDETKSVLIISKKSKAITEAIVHELGLGLTIMYGRGGFSGDEREILYVIAERLQLAELKEIVFGEDPSAFMAIENLHEVANGNQGHNAKSKKSSIEKIVSKFFAKK